MGLSSSSIMIKQYDLERVKKPLRGLSFLSYKNGG